MDLVHVEVVELLFPEIVNDILSVARATFLHVGHGAIGSKEYDQQFPSILRGKLASLCQDVECGGQRAPVEEFARLLSEGRFAIPIEGTAHARPRSTGLFTVQG